MADSPSRGGDYAQNALRDVQALTHDPQEQRDREELGLDLVDASSGDADALLAYRQSLLGEAEDRLAALNESLNRIGGGPNTRAYLKNRPNVDSPEAAADRAAARAAIARADAGDMNDSSGVLYKL